MHGEIMARSAETLDLAPKVADDNDLSQCLLDCSVCRHLIQELVFLRLLRWGTAPLQL